MSDEHEKYETDFAAWSADQAERLRQHSTEIDWENIAEEIESLGAARNAR